jgi:putative transcriptional regulator
MTRALLALLVLCCSSSPWAADSARTLTTILLVARDELPDPNFRGSIVLVMNHIGPAPAGVIVNRPTRLRVSRLFPELEHLARLDDKVYFGGPVDIQSVSFLVRAERAPEHAAEVVDGVYVSSNRELLRNLLARDNPMEGLRIFIGYSGWARGQLEAEIARGDWKLAPADASAIFDAASEHPWPEPQPPGDGQRASRPESFDGEALTGGTPRARRVAVPLATPWASRFDPAPEAGRTPTHDIATHRSACPFRSGSGCT